MNTLTNTLIVINIRRTLQFGPFSPSVAVPITSRSPLIFEAFVELGHVYIIEYALVTQYCTCKEVLNDQFSKIVGHFSKIKF